MKHQISALLEDVFVRCSFRHVSGPKIIHLAPDEAGLVLLAKDVEWFLPEYINHHFSIGVSHILIVDNGSTDRSLEMANQDRVTVLRSNLTVKKHESRMRAMAAKQVYRGGWIMFADADEMIEIPLKSTLPRLLAYCNERRFTSVIGQMIDLFAHDTPQKQDYKSSVSLANLYSLNAIDSFAYGERSFELNWFLKENECSDRGVKLMKGGLRWEIFGENPLLSKHTLVRNAPPAQIMTHPHCASRIVVADVTIAIRHYKLAGDWIARDRSTVRSKTWDHNEDVRRLEAASGKSFGISPAEPRVWGGSEVLLAEGFLYASPSARSALSG